MAMFTEEATIETLRRWSHILLWISIALPVLGALAAGARYYVERYEKQLSGRLTANAITEARQGASAARRELSELKQKSAPRELSADQREKILGVLRRTKGAVQILYPADTEAQIFAKRIGVVIREGGWEVTEEGAMFFGPVVGLKIETHDEINAPNYTTVLREALDIVFGNVLFRSNQNVDKGTLRLTVGSKSLE
jgi:hypothetical protein